MGVWCMRNEDFDWRANPIMSNELFILLAFMIPALLTVLGLLFKVLFRLSRLETKLTEIKFEVRNLDAERREPSETGSTKQ